MSDNDTGFKITDSVAGFNRADFNDVFVNKNCFAEGNLWGWGRNTSGNLGDNSVTNKSSPVQTISGGINWKYIEASETGSAGVPSTAAGIKSDGSLWMWGSSAFGIIGENTLIDRSSPVQTISGGTNWKNVSLTSNGVAAAIKTDGSLWTWGRNGLGQLGIDNIANRSSPVQTCSGGTNWKQLSVGGFHTTAIKTDGTLWVWGHGDRGDLGDNMSTVGGVTHRRSSPIQTISGGTNWRSVSANFFNTVATKTDGTLWSWGFNCLGMLGLGDIIDRSTPTQMESNGTMWKSASMGPFHAAGIKTDGSLWIWGSCSDGKLGTNSNISQSSPVQTISGGTNWRLVRAAHFNTRAIKTDGTLWSWGSNLNGLLGDNTTIAKSTPVQIMSGGTNWTNISGGSYAAGAIRDSGNII